ncbi:MAG: ABC transporter ATP-binding protein [Planctomycetaceae bacterium]|nr:ABC transporter ATP-binding protein [Planctomycetaceae bacterium]
MNSDMEPAVIASGLGRDYGTHTVLQGVNLSVPQGSVCALLGRNGVGKTTLLKLLSSLIQPTHGTCTVLGDSTWPRTAITLAKTGVVIDGFEPPLVARVKHLLELGAAASPSFDRKRADELLKSREINPAKPWTELSKGQKRWCLLVTALCRKCDVLLLDEPADGLDPQSRVDLYQMVRREANETGLTALIATHIISDIERVADRLAILHEKTILLESDLDTLRDELWVITCDTAPAAADLPVSIEVLHQTTGTPTEIWIRQHESCDVPSLSGEIERRKPTVEELFRALTGKPSTEAAPEPTPAPVGS